jgi:hypothetical protein
MATVFKAGDRVRSKYGYSHPAVVKRVFANCYELDEGTGGETRIVLMRHAHATYRLVALAPPSFASCTDPGTQPACSNETMRVKPEPTRLQEAREATLHAVRRLMYAHATIGQIDRHIEHVIREAKAEAIAEREALEPKPYGRVVATAGATRSSYRREGDVVELTFTVCVPRHATIACADPNATDFRVTATSKGAR